MRFARVTALSLVGSTPVCSICDESSGAIFSECRFLCDGGGTADDIDYNPPQLGARVAYSLLAGNTQVAIVGTVYEIRNKRIVQDFQPVSYDEAFPGEVSVRDRFMEKGNAWFILTYDGQLVMDSSQAHMPIRLQVGTGYEGHVRIDQDGNADEHLLLAGPTRDYLDKLHNDIVELRTLLAAFAADCASTGVGAKAAPGIATQQSGPWATDIVQGQTADDLVASAVRISSRTVLDDVV